MLLVCLRVDASGCWPVLLTEADLACASGVEWHFFAPVEDVEQGRKLVRELEKEFEGRGLHATQLRIAPRATGSMRRADIAVRDDHSQFLPIVEAAPDPRLSPVLRPVLEEVRHHVDARITGMVEAGEPEAGLE